MGCGKGSYLFEQGERHVGVAYARQDLDEFFVEPEVGLEAVPLDHLVVEHTHGRLDLSQDSD